MLSRCPWLYSAVTNVYTRVKSCGIAKRITFSSAEAKSILAGMVSVAAVAARNLRRLSFISGSSLCFRFEPSPLSVTKRPYEKVVANVIVDFGETERLPEQKADD